MNPTQDNYQDYKAWFDWWLDDEPPSHQDQVILNHIHAQHMATRSEAEPVHEDLREPRQLVIKFSISRHWLSKASLALCSATLAITVLASLAFKSMPVKAHNPLAYSEQQTSSGQSSPKVLGSATSTKASFKPVAPIGKSELANYAPGKTEYDPKYDMYTYSDTFQGSPLTVSEHKLISKFSSTADAVNKLAAQIDATQKIDLISGSAYLKNNPPGSSEAQDIILSEGNLLLYVESQYSHSVADWQVYLNSLQ